MTKLPWRVRASSYAMRSGDRVKIGASTQDLTRQDQLEKMSGRKLEIIATGLREIEDLAKKELAEYQ